jgi:hypothetical protein
LIALEANIVEMMHAQFQANVPTIIAHNPKHHCFLMNDAGQTLRDSLKHPFDLGLLCKAIDQFTALQLATSKRLDLFFDIGS